MAEQRDRKYAESAAGRTGRRVVQGVNGIVCSGHHLTSMAGMRVLLGGGNAFDAAVAAGFAAAVVEPTASYSLAAEVVGMFHHAASGEVRAVSGQGVAPRAATVSFFRNRGFDKIPTGPGDQAHMAFTVPGAVDAFLRLLKAYGTKAVGEVLEPAIDYAEHGFPVYEQMRDMLENPDARDQLARYPPGGTGVFYPNGSTPPMDGLLKQPQLGRTLRLLAAGGPEGSGTRMAGIEAARAVFYEGEIAERIAAFSERWGGLLRREDLAGYHAAVEEPLETTFVGYEISTQSTWTQGAVLLQALNMLAHVDLQALGHNSPAYVHTVTEVLKLALADRERYYGDPDFSPVPIEALLADDYAAARVRLVGAAANPGLPAHGEIGAVERRIPPAATPKGSPSPGTASRAGIREGTTHLAVIDRDGNMVCLTASGGAFLKSAFMSDLGCTLSTRSEMFFLDETHPNGLQPAKRPRTTLVSYIARRDGVPVMAFGCPGGDDQTQANLQMMLNVLVFGMDPQRAVEEPRFSTQSVTNSFYPRAYLPGQLNLEHAFPRHVAEELAGRGHRIVRVDTCGAGAVITRRDPRTGVLTAGADPRRHTYAIAW